MEDASKYAIIHKEVSTVHVEEDIYQIRSTEKNVQKYQFMKIPQKKCISILIIRLTRQATQMDLITEI